LHLLLRSPLKFLKDTILVIPLSIIIDVNFLVNIIPRPPLLRLRRLIEYFIDVEEEFPNTTYIIGFSNMACYNIPVTNFTSGVAKFLPNIKEIFDTPPKAKKRMSRYDIYK
jgi:hypothetical protein